MWCRFGAFRQDGLPKSIGGEIAGQSPQPGYNCRAIFRHRPKQDLHSFVRRHCHFDWIAHRAFSLLFNVSGPAIPELREMAGRIVYGWSVPVTVLASIACGRRLPIDAVFHERMTTVARNRLAL